MISAIFRFFAFPSWHSPGISSSGDIALWSLFFDGVVHQSNAFLRCRSRFGEISSTLRPSIWARHNTATKVLFHFLCNTKLTNIYDGSDCDNSSPLIPRSGTSLGWRCTWFSSSTAARPIFYKRSLPKSCSRFPDSSRTSLRSSVLLLVLLVLLALAPSARSCSRSKLSRGRLPGWSLRTDWREEDPS